MLPGIHTPTILPITETMSGDEVAEIQAHNDQEMSKYGKSRAANDRMMAAYIIGACTLMLGAFGVMALLQWWNG